ncbi:MAG: PEP-CTERM system TPR-repeat protein PrsT [Rubrivivax sp.]|nr:PEP-CTERM system TPR-repeat protein PrsT [Rubrivivax sp.]
MKQVTPRAATLVAIAACLVACSQPSPEELATQAGDFAAKGDHVSAIIAAKAALAQGQGSAELRFRLGQLLLTSRDGNSAIQEFRKAIELGHPRDQVIPQMARAHLLAGQPEALTRGLANPPLKDRQAAASLAASVAEAWSMLREPAKMQQSLDEALRLDPEQAHALRFKARLLGARGDTAGASAIVQDLLKRAPADAEALQLRGEIQRVQGDTAGATASFREALEKNASLIEPRLHLIGQHLVDKDVAAARKELESMRQALPRHPMVSYAEAQILLREGDAARARDLGLALLRAAPDNVNVLLLAGTAEMQAGSLLVARSHLAKASQIEPEHAAVRRSLAMVLLRLGQPQAASAALADLAAQPNADALTLTLAGRAAMANDDIAGAERLLARALQQAPDDRNARLARAMASLQSSTGAERGLAQLQELSASDTDTEADKALAGVLVARRQWDQAVAAIDSALKKTPKDPALHEMKGRVYAAQQRFPEARSALELALQSDPRHFAATLVLAQIDLVQKQPQQALERVKAAAVADRRNTAASLAQLKLMAATGASADEQRDMLVASIKANPGDADLRTALVELLLSRKRFREALAAAQEADSAMSGSLALLDSLGRAQRATGSIEQAINTFKRAASLDPTSAVPHSRLADMALALGDIKQAEVHLRQALAVAPELGALQMRLVELLLSNRRPAEALAFARQVQQSSPQRANGHLLEGALQERAGALDKAVPAYKAAAQREPDRSDVMLPLHKALLAVGSAAEADALAVKWLERRPNDVEFAYQVAIADMVRERYALAEERLAAIVKAYPTHPLALNNLAWLLTRAGKPGGTELARRADAALPNTPAILDTLAMALAGEKKIDEAVKVQRRAIELAPDNHNVRLNLARLEIQAADAKAARLNLQRLAELGSKFPHQAEVSRLLGTLR